jgi:hypothetical protein
VKPILFAGPTLARAHAIRRALPFASFEIAFPIRRGDLPAMVRARPPGVVVIADGLFHAALAVGHAEIRATIAAGWRVHGVSSMGAIRAAEMHELGMTGFGEVFEWYARGTEDVRDDEVALLHESDPPFRELSEPLVHIRRLLAHLTADGTITRDKADAVVADLANRWFGERTLGLVARLVGVPIAAQLADMDRHRIKAHDLITLMDTLAATDSTAR